MDPAARSYEDGQSIRQDFIDSWNEVESWYAEFDHKDLNGLLSFISAARQMGFDERLRAGTAAWFFIVSRSRRHGLRTEQPRIVVRINEGILHAVLLENSLEVASTSSPNFNDVMVELFERLARYKID